MGTPSRTDPDLSREGRAALQEFYRFPGVLGAKQISAVFPTSDASDETSHQQTISSKAPAAA